MTHFPFHARLPVLSALLACSAALPAAASSDYGVALGLPSSLPQAPAVSPAFGQEHALPTALPLATAPQRPLWQLHRGALLHEELSAWAHQAGWQLRWEPAITWQVAADSTFQGTFDAAVAKVIESLYLEGQPVRLMLWEGNRVAEVVSHEVR